MDRTTGSCQCEEQLKPPFMQLIKVQYGSIIRTRPNMHHQGIEDFDILYLLRCVTHVSRMDCKLDVCFVAR